MINNCFGRHVDINSSLINFYIIKYIYEICIKYISLGAILEYIHYIGYMKIYIFILYIMYVALMLVIQNQ